MSYVIEVLQYTLTPGLGSDFHSVMREHSIPLHCELGLKVLTYGNSLHDNDKYFLIREFPGITEMERQLAGFYDDSRWKEGPRQAIVSMIQMSHRVVMPADQARIFMG